jgi:hypothetical protein
MAQNLVVNFIGNNKLDKTATVASNTLKKFGRTADGVSKNFNKAFGAVGIGLGFASLTGYLKRATEGFEKAQIASAKLDNVLTSMGFGSATKRVDAYAESLQKTLAIDADLIKATQTKLATFSALTATVNTAGGAFDRATVASLDLAAAGFGSAESQAVALGKALQDPIKGITSLRKSGVTFTKSEQDKIKTLVESNRLLDAQNVILTAIETQVGGTAEAGVSAFARMQLIFDSMSDTVGEALLPAIKEFNEFLVSPEGEKSLQQVAGLFVAVGQALSNVIKFLIENITLVKALTAAVIFARVSWTVLSGAVKIYTVLTKNAVTATKLLRTALITTGIGALVVGLGFLAEGWITANEEKDNYMAPDVVEGDSSIHEWAEKNRESLIPYESDAWLRLGYESYGNYLQGMYNAAMEKNAKQATVAKKIAEVAEKVKKAVDDKIAGMKKTAENFRDAIGLAFGTFGKDETSVFNVDVVINKLKRLLDAAKGFAGNLQKLRKAGATEDVINEIVGMGPAQGNIVAKGLLSSGKLSEYLSLRGSLYNTGAQAGAQQAIAGNASYTINLEGTNVKATDIINAIRAYEKKHGRKYLLG